MKSHRLKHIYFIYIVVISFEITLLLSLEALTFVFVFHQLKFSVLNCKVMTECLEALLNVFLKRGSRISIICFGQSTEFEFSISCTSFVIYEIMFSVVKESKAFRRCLDHFFQIYHNLTITAIVSLCQKIVPFL